MMAAGWRPTGCMNSITGRRPGPVPEHGTGPEPVCVIARIQVRATPVSRSTAPARATRTAAAVVLSRGARGATLAAGPSSGPRHVPAPPAANVVDTTGAGDALVGVLAAALAAGRDLPTAVRAAVVAATRSVGAPGAAPSYPAFDIDPPDVS